MVIARETAIEILVSALCVGGFIASVLYVGVTYSENGLSETGALAIVVLIVGFILVMTAVGYWLSTREA